MKEIDLSGYKTDLSTSIQLTIGKIGFWRLLWWQIKWILGYIHLSIRLFVFNPVYFTWWVRLMMSDILKRRGK